MIIIFECMLIAIACYFFVWFIHSIAKAVIDRDDETEEDVHLLWQHQNCRCDFCVPEETEREVFEIPVLDSFPGISQYFSPLPEEKCRYCRVKTNPNDRYCVACGAPL